MTNSAAGPSELTTQERQELIGLRMIWDRCYAINCDGLHWTAIHIDSEAVLQAGTSEGLRSLIRKDNTARAARKIPGGAWTEAASGAPHRHHASREQVALTAVPDDFS